VAYVGIGSNLDDPAAQVERAVRALASLEACELRARSALYGSAPLGPPDQPDYVNAVVALKTTLPARALLSGLQAIEADFGRRRESRRWGARVIDLDLLLYGDAVIESADLKVPHPGIASRAFVLAPLREIAPDLRIPGWPPLDELLRRCPPPAAVRLAPADAGLRNAL
jgi:2-amino-4-hydroxy-6-hydroxymethyldihydropteridine diphosphokinase